MTSIALITGANKGIGFATARHLAAAGHTVLLGARDPERGRAAVAELAGAGLDAHVVQLDVLDQTSIDAAAHHIDTDYGRLDILINNAAISRERPLAPSRLPAAVYREVLETNVIGVVAVIHAMLPLLRRSTRAVIGNVSSGLGTMTFLTDAGHPHRQYANLLAYNSSKAALNAVTVIYAQELAEAGIRVNALSPGHCATDLNGHTGTLTADEGGAHIARQVLQPDVTGVFLHEDGGTYPW
jgi:NAD(P)-dependent dehydrogenase (short-subunit alcohol dehydrogenase family)